MTEYFLESFCQGDFTFLGAYTFSNGKSNFLLGKNGCSVFLCEELTEQISSGKVDKNLMLKLVQHGLGYIPGKEMFSCEKQADIRYFIIDLTKKCNFDCIYCFRDFQDHPDIPMDTLKDVLQYILKYCQKESIKRIGIQLWGGEPLLALDRIEYVVRFFEQTNLRVSFDIETNGSLVTQEVAEKLYQWGIHVGVSLDGPPQLQNMQRPLASGTPSSDLAEAGIKNLQKYYKNNIGGITVVTRHNFRHIKEMLDYFIYGLHLKSMKFNLVRDNDHAAEKRLALTEEEVTWFANELLDYLQAFRTLGADFTEGNVEVRLKNLLQRSRISCCISNGCQGGKKMVSFDREGNIFPCEMIDFPEEKIGSVYDDEDIAIQLKCAMKKNLFFTPKESEKCRTCPWWCYCGGGCSSRNRYLNRDGQIDEVECALNRVMYPRLIEGLLQGYIGLEMR